MPPRNKLEAQNVQSASTHVKTCERCGKEFASNPSRKHKFCSDSCRNIAYFRKVRAEAQAFRALKTDVNH